MPIRNLFLLKGISRGRCCRVFLLSWFRYRVRCVGSSFLALGDSSRHLLARGWRFIFGGLVSCLRRIGFLGARDWRSSFDGLVSSNDCGRFVCVAFTGAMCCSPVCSCCLLFMKWIVGLRSSRAGGVLSFYVVFCPIACCVSGYVFQRLGEDVSGGWGCVYGVCGVWVG